MTAARRSAVSRWGDVQWPTRRSAEWSEGLAVDPNIEAIIAIGSAARGSARSASDVDLIIVCKNAHTHPVAPPEVDARWVDVAKLHASIEKGDDVFAWGIAFGVPLYDPNKTWGRLVSHWRNHLPLPTVDVCAQRAARARRYVEALVESGDDDAASEQALTMLTHEARRLLAGHGVFPASRPELVDQLEGIGESRFAAVLHRAIEGSLPPREALAAYEP